MDVTYCVVKQPVWYL